MNGVAGYQVVIESNLPVAAGGVAQEVVDCPEGKKAIGGGFFGFVPEVVAFRSFPQGADFEAWIVVVKNTGSGASAFDAYAICADVDG